MISDYRYEIKFVLDNAKLSEVIQWLNNSTSATEKYNKRIVNSIYFDDVNFSSVQDNLGGISQRNKLRLRWYDENENRHPIFEVKKKNDRMGQKKSYQIKSINKNILKLNYDLITSKCIEDLETQKVLLDKYIIPTLYVKYEREYYETHNGIRITIDQNIQFSDTHLYTSLDENSLFSYPAKVMEIKFNKNMKDEVSELLTPLHISPKRHSKYLIGLAILGLIVYI